MPYAITLLRTAEKTLDKLARQQPGDASAIEDAIEALADDPRPNGHTNLKGYPGVCRIRIGNYRVCYRIDDGNLVVLVVAVGTRGTVYELVRRQLRGR